MQTNLCAALRNSARVVGRGGASVLKLRKSTFKHLKAPWTTFARAEKVAAPAVPGALPATLPQLAMPMPMAGIGMDPAISKSRMNDKLAKVAETLLATRMHGSCIEVSIAPHSKIKRCRQDIVDDRPTSSQWPPHLFAHSQVRAAAGLLGLATTEPEPTKEKSPEKPPPKAALGRNVRAGHHPQHRTDSLDWPWGVVLQIHIPLVWCTPFPNKTS